MKLKKLLVISTLVATPVVHADPPQSVKDPAKKPTPAKAAEAPPSAPTAPQISPPSQKPTAPPIDPATAKKNSSYGFGFRAGREFAGQTNRFGLTIDDLDKEIFMKGFFDSYLEKDSSIPQAEINAAFNALQKIVSDREKAIGDKNLTEGQKFLEENGKRAGVITTESGLQYEIITKGEGETYKVPEEAASGGQDRTRFMIQYEGTLIDGTQFDSSDGRTVPMGMSTVPGFKEALTTMPVGSNWKIFLKPELAYGPNRRSPKIGPNSTLIFDVTLEKINVIPPPPSQAQGQRPTAVSPPVRVPSPSGVKSSGGNSQRPAMSKPIKVPARPKAPADAKKGTPPATSGPVKVPPPTNEKKSE